MRPGSAGKRPVAEDAPRHDESVGLRTAPSTRGPARALAGRCCRRSHKRAGDRFDRRAAAPGARRSRVQQNGSTSETDPIGCCCSLISNREPPTPPACSAPLMAPLTTRSPSAPPPAKQHRDVRRGSACEREQVRLVSDHRGVVPPDRSSTQRLADASTAFLAARDLAVVALETPMRGREDGGQDACFGSASGNPVDRGSGARFRRQPAVSRRPAAPMLLCHGVAQELATCVGADAWNEEEKTRGGRRARPPTLPQLGA